MTRVVKVFYRDDGELYAVDIDRVDGYSFIYAPCDFYGGDSSEMSMFYVDQGELKKKPPKLDNVEFQTFSKAEGVWKPNAKLIGDRAIEMRAGLLAASDWTQLPDVPEATRHAWQSYRQALRDITAQPGYPLNIVWPEPPGKS